MAAAMPIGWSVAPRFTRHLVREDQPVEWMQVGLFLVATVLACRLALRWRRDRRTRGVAALAWTAFALLAFTTLEEISWGQRILGFETPELLRKGNVQGEFNLHNLPWFHEVRGYLTVTVGVCGVCASRAATLLRGGRAPLWLRTVAPSPLTTLSFLYFLVFSVLMVVLGLQRSGSSPDWDLGRVAAEWAELLLSWSAFLYTYLKVSGHDLPAADDAQSPP